MAAPSFASANPELVEEVIAQADARLQAQLTAALAADQRAMTFAGLLFAGIAALIGFAAAHSGALHNECGMVAVTLGFVVAAALACWSARPVKWHLVGNYPSSWDEDVRLSKRLPQTRAETAANYEEALQENERALQSAATFMRLSMTVGLVSAVAGVIFAFDVA